MSVRDWGTGTVIHFDAPVVLNFDLNEHAGTAFVAVNDMNRELYFAKFVVYAGEDGQGAISAEYDLLGDDLRGSGFMNGLELVAGLADSNDERLQADIGGNTYEEWVAATRSSRSRPKLVGLVCPAYSATLITALMTTREQPSPGPRGDTCGTWKV